MLIKLEMSPTITLQPGDIPSSQSWLPTFKSVCKGEGRRESGWWVDSSSSYQVNEPPLFRKAKKCHTYIDAEMQTF